MSDVLADVDSREAMKVRLLTFDWLPFTDDLSASETLFEAMDELSAESVFFESHYLQSQGPGGILSRLPSGLEGRFFLVRGASEEGRTEISAFGSLSAILQCETTVPSEGRFSDTTGLLRKTAEDPFCWLHFKEESEADITAAFSAALSLMREMREQNCIVLVTALNGRKGDLSRFDSSLPESLIHAPLWLLGFDQLGRCQPLTGSFDIGCTIRDLLQMEFPASAPDDSLPKRAPLSLWGIAGDLARGLERELPIEAEGISAIRSDQFLLVQRPGEVGEESSVFLYAKPEDVWNVNNVAAEYREAVEKMSQYST